jgi:Na+/H+-translocating membrane pyrophosphatase
MPETIPYLALVAGGISLALAAYYARTALAAPEGDAVVRDMGKAIREGAMEFMRREYAWTSLAGVILIVLLVFILDLGRFSSVSFVV